MNFYKHHLGDYDGATTHLSWLEDMAYTRLLRVYYRREGPLPDDLPQLCRLVRASRSDERRAVETVLREFFTLSDGAWHNERADEEIEAYQRQASTNRRIAKQRTVPRNSNESLNEPSHESLNESHHEPPTIRIPNHKPEARSQKKSDTALIITTPGPVETKPAPLDFKGEIQTQGPSNIGQLLDAITPTRTENPEPDPDPPPDGASPTAAGQWAGELRRKGVSVSSQHPTLRQWIADGFTLPWALEALEIARQSKPDGNIAANYLDRIIRDPPKKKSNGGAWWATEQSTIAKGNELGITARPGETMDAFKSRITEALGKQRQQA